MNNNTEQYYINRIVNGAIAFTDIKKTDQTEAICLAAVKAYPPNFHDVVDKTEAICLEAVKGRGDLLEYIENQTEEMCIIAVNDDTEALHYVKKQTDKICLAAVKRNGWALEYVENKTEEICLEAVRYIGDALMFVENQTEEICLTAVGNRCMALKYAKIQTKKMCDTAVKYNPRFLAYVDENIYEYNPKDIENALKIPRSKILNDASNIELLDKIGLILLKLNNDELIKAVKEDLKFIFNDEFVDGANWDPRHGNIFLKISDKLSSAKQKAEMLLSLKDANGCDSGANINNTTKPKII